MRRISPQWILVFCALLIAGYCGYRELTTGFVTNPLELRPPVAQGHDPATRRQPESTPAPAGLQLELFPAEGATDVPPDVVIAMEISEPGYTPFGPLNLDLRRHESFVARVECTLREGPPLRIECPVARPLHFGFEYQASLSFGLHGPRGQSTRKVHRSWSFTTQRREQRVAGVLPAGVVAWLPSSGDDTIEVQAAAGTLPPEAITERWQVSVISGTSRAACLLKADGGFVGYLEAPRSDTQPFGVAAVFELEIVDSSGARRQRFPIGPLLSRRGGHLAYHSSWLFQVVRPDGVLVRVDQDGHARGMRRESTWRKLTVAESAESCEPEAVPMRSVGCWTIELVQVHSDRHGQLRELSPPPASALRNWGIQVFLPAPALAREGNLVVDTTWAEDDWWSMDRRRRELARDEPVAHKVLVRGLGRATRIGERLVLSLESSFRLSGCEGCGPDDELTPNLVYGSGLFGTHRVYLDLVNEMTVVAAPLALEGGAERVWLHEAPGGDWVAYDPSSLLELAVPIGGPPRPGQRSGARGPVVVLPVMADREFAIVGHIRSGSWESRAVKYSAQPRSDGVIRYVKKLDEACLEQHGEWWL